jgi:hypothetical protein
LLENLKIYLNFARVHRTLNMFFGAFLLGLRRETYLPYKKKIMELHVLLAVVESVKGAYILRSRRCGMSAQTHRHFIGQ